MKRILVVYHSLTGGSLQMARAAADGAAAEQEVATRLLHATEAGPADVLAADAYIFVTPENLGSMAGLLKDFFDRTYYAALDKVNGRPYATLICAGSDGRGAARQIERIVTGWRLKSIAEPMIFCTHPQSLAATLQAKLIGAAELASCAEIGAALAAGLVLGVF